MQQKSAWHRSDDLHDKYKYTDKVEYFIAALEALVDGDTEIDHVLSAINWGIDSCIGTSNNGAEREILVEIKRLADDVLVPIKSAKAPREIPTRQLRSIVDRLNKKRTLVVRAKKLQELQELEVAIAKAQHDAKKPPSIHETIRDALRPIIVQVETAVALRAEGLRAGTKYSKAEIKLLRAIFGSTWSIANILRPLGEILAQPITLALMAFFILQAGYSPAITVLVLIFVYVAGNEIRAFVIRHAAKAFDRLQELVRRDGP